MLDTLQTIKGGPVELGYITEAGEFEPFSIEDHNLVLYSGEDITARLLAGQAEYTISSMYMEFTGEAVVPTVVPVKDAGRSYYEGLTEGDALRVPITMTPTVSASDSNHQGNVVTYVAVATATAGAFRSEEFGIGDKVYGAALVATPTDNKSGDVVFSRIYFTNPIENIENAQIGVRWKVSVVQ